MVSQTENSIKQIEEQENKISSLYDRIRATIDRALEYYSKQQCSGVEPQEFTVTQEEYEAATDYFQMVLGVNTSLTTILGMKLVVQ
jgi:histidinol dehydrogenase